MLSYLRTQLVLQLPFGLVSELPTFMLLSPVDLTPIRVVAKAKMAKVNFIHNSGGTLDSKVCMALLDFMSHDHR